MGYDNPNRDEDGEPLMTFDEIGSDEDPQEDADPNPDLHLVDEDEDDYNWRRQERSPTPVYNNDSKAKPRKRLVKKGGGSKGGGGGSEEDEGPGFEDENLADFGEESGGYDEVVKAGKRKKFSSKDGSGSSSRKREKLQGSGSKGGKMRKGGFSGGGGRDEEKEMWDTVAGGDSEDDQNGNRTLDDDTFIDDAGVDPGDRYGSDNEQRSPSHAPQAEEGEEEDEINQLFKSGKKKKKTEKSAGEIALLVENVMAELEVIAEEDAELNRQSKPAINKLRKLPFLTEVLSKKQLQQEFLDHGVLTLLKNWLEPLPDGSLPNINSREAILRILTDFPIDLDQFDRKEQLKKSGLGKVIMFLSKSDEETTSNKKLAKDLVDKWSRPIFNKSTRFEDMRNFEDERAPFRRPSVKKPMNKSSGRESRDDDLDTQISQGRKSGQSSARGLTARPEAMALDFLVRPQSKIDPDEVRARSKQIVQDQRRLKMNKKMTQLKAPKKKQLQATKLSVEGRGMVKYL